MPISVSVSSHCNKIMSNRIYNNILCHKQDLMWFLNQYINLLSLTPSHDHWFPRWYLASPTICLHFLQYSASSSLTHIFFISLPTSSSSFLWVQEMSFPLNSLSTPVFIKVSAPILITWPSHLNCRLYASATMSGVP